MSDYPRFFKRDQYSIGDLTLQTGWDILWFRTWHFFFKWFTDCGEWFVYLEWHWKRTVWYLRFSSAGFMKGKYDEL